MAMPNPDQIPFDQMLRLVDNLSAEKQERLRQNLNRKSWGEHQPFFDGQIDLDVLAAEQGVPAMINCEDLRGDFWPEDECLDDFLDAVHNWRQESLTKDS